MIPDQFTCNGADKSPPLAWQQIPDNTKSLALVVEDQDAPNGVLIHWIVFNIPPNVTQLDENGILPEGAVIGNNSWDSPNYRGPCPSMGAHRYVFKLYAVDKMLSLNKGAAKDTILQAMTGHVISNAELVGLYQK